jgi:plastocyanin
MKETGIIRKKSVAVGAVLASMLVASVLVVAMEVQPVMADSSNTIEVIGKPGNWFSPGELTVKTGTVVTWKVSDKAYSMFMITSGTAGTPDAGKLFKSQFLRNGQEFSFKFDTVGTFVYHDGQNPPQTGKVIVEGSGSTAPPSTPSTPKSTPQSTPSQKAITPSTGKNAKIAFQSNDGLNFDIYTINSDGSGLAKLTNFGKTYWPSAMPDGRVAFYRGDTFLDEKYGTLDNSNFGWWAMKADGGGLERLKALDLLGTMYQRSSDPSYSWSRDGTKAVTVAGAGNGGNYLLVVNADGTGVKEIKPTIVGDRLGITGRISISPDGTTIAGGSGRIYISNLDGTGLKFLTSYTSDEDPKWYFTAQKPQWSPDGTKIYFVGTDNQVHKDASQMQLYVVNGDGTGLTKLTDKFYFAGDYSLSPDGTKIVAKGFESGSNLALYTLNADGTGLKVIYSQKGKVTHSPVWLYAEDGASVKTSAAKDPTKNITISAGAKDKSSKAFGSIPVKVKKGTVVTWKNNDATSHQIVSGKGPTDKDSGKLFDSKAVAAKKSFSFKFDTKGTYDYYCKIHPTMVGKVAVG